MNKHMALLALAKQRQQTRWGSYRCLHDYHGGAYECELISPYTKTAGNVDSDIFILLQDWASDDFLSRPIHQECRDLGHAPKLPTNRNLINLLQTTFGKGLKDVYGTNLFPFIKPKGMSQPVPHSDLVKAAVDFALPQIRIVQPAVVVCLGLATFNALRSASGMAVSPDLDSAIRAPFEICDARIWCQAHTGHWGQVNRNRTAAGQVSKDWQAMKTDLERAKM